MNVKISKKFKLSIASQHYIGAVGSDSGSVGAATASASAMSTATTTQGTRDA